MSPRTEATKQKLFDATLRLASTKGMAALTVDDIAAEAGVAKGTVYYNFGSKDGLIDALLRYGVDLLADRLRQAREVEDLVDAALSYFADYPSFAQLLVSELWSTPGKWHETLTLLRDDIISIIKEHMQRLTDEGRLPDGVQTSTASAALFGTLLVVALDWQVFQKHRSQDDVRDSVMLLVRGLGQKSS